jgi:hypothetical protein
MGGFYVKAAKTRKEKEGSDASSVDAQDDQQLGPDGKPKRKQRKQKVKSKLLETFPTYIQDAFFGKQMLSDSNSGSTERDQQQQQQVPPGSASPSLTNVSSQQVAMQAVGVPLVNGNKAIVGGGQLSQKKNELLNGDDFFGLEDDDLGGDKDGIDLSQVRAQLFTF